MQNYTQLKLRELQDKLVREREAEWEKEISLSAAKGLGGQLFVRIETIGIQFLDKLIDDIFSNEKAVLSKEMTHLPNDYFQTLENEIIRFAQQNLRAIVSKQLGLSRRMANVSIEKYCQEEFETNDHRYMAIIKNKIEILKEELRIGITSPIGTIVNVGDVAVLNTGIVYGSIHGKIEKMRETSVVEIADMFDQILAAIKDSQISEEEKFEQMQNIEFLVTQFQSTPDKRNRGLISASLNFLSLAANLTTIWGQFGTMIEEAFKNIFL